MRIALISDVHANEMALKAVLKDIRHVGVDRIVCLGDIATIGPHPCSAIQIIRELGCDCVLGNHDEFMFKPDLVYEYTEIPPFIEAVEWARNQMSKEDLDFINTFRPNIEISLSEKISLSLFHGQPHDNMGNILSTTPPDALDKILDGNSSIVMACGHTHIQMLRQHKGCLIVNPGSVGLPFKEFVDGGQPVILDHSEYAIIEIEQHNMGVSFRRVQYDQKEYKSTIESSKNPMKGLLLESIGMHVTG